ncbi:GGDEF domain-containing protein [Kangiella marina]|uniref:GGDEF domain-containing protein n=1 Tax=Kangiella marina TaxID=1079178 RepID=UPI0031ED538F
MEVHYIQNETKRQYLIRQSLQLKKWALLGGLIYYILSTIADFRFPPAVYQQTIPARLFLVLVPLMFITWTYWRKDKFDYTFNLGLLLYLGIASGLVHGFVYYTVIMSGGFFPKVGMAMLLLYSCLLLGLPILFGAICAVVLIVTAAVVYYLTSMPVINIALLTAFYTLFSVCCLIANKVCYFILKENYQLVQKIYHISIYDELTQVFNRRYFVENLHRIYHQAKREQSMLSIVTIDLDNFKLLNDTYGHVAGDDALVKISTIIKKYCKRPLDFVARTGGDEFAVLLYGSNQSHIEGICKSILSDIKSLSIQSSDDGKIISASIGVASTDFKGSVYDIEELIHNSDVAAYQSKKNGKNRFTVFNSES